MMKITKKSLLLLIATALLLTVTVSGTVAYLMAGTDPVVNNFTPGVMDTKIEEVVSTGAKDSIVIELHNDSNMDAYVRVALIGNWIDAQGNVIAPWNPQEMASGFVLNDAAWVRGPGGYYYHKTRIKPGQPTANLLKQRLVITQGDMQSGAKELVLAVVHQSIQADGVTANGTPAVVDAWDWWPDDIEKPATGT